MKQKYCESPALGMGAPKCSEDCCDYGGCHKQAYFEYIANKYNTTPDKIAIGTNFQFDKFVIEDREYSNEEVLEILKKHKTEEDKKYHKMDNELLKYLTEEDKKSIAERVFEEEIRKTIKEDLDKRDLSIFNDKTTIYGRIISQYINEMDLYHEDFIECFKKRISDETKILLSTDMTEIDIKDTTATILDNLIKWKIQDIGKSVIEESKEELKPIIREKVFKCCNETLLIAFLSDIVRSMNLNETVKKIIQESEGDKK